VCASIAAGAVECIVDDVRAALDESGLDPSHLVLEITESMLMQNTDISMDRLTSLKALGISLAIDDFGTGYSSLSYLQRYPIDILKIDKAFVDVIDKGGEGPVLASAIVALGETLRMKTVAEGIETEAQRGHLMQLGCELGQGFLFAPPVEAADFYRLLVARGARWYSSPPRFGGRGVAEAAEGERRACRVGEAASGRITRFAQAAQRRLRGLRHCGAGTVAAARA